MAALRFKVALFAESGKCGFVPNFADGAWDFARALQGYRQAGDTKRGCQSTYGVPGARGSLPTFRRAAGRSRPVPILCSRWRPSV